jgi:hypothetical protein
MSIKSGKVQNRFFRISTHTISYLLDDRLAEDIVLPLFGPCHQRCTTTPLLLILRFNSGNPLRLSSVMVPRNLQLNSSQPLSAYARRSQMQQYLVCVDDR